MLNLKAGQKAKLASSYSEASKYLKIALALRDSTEEDPWEGEARQTTMELYLDTITALFWNLEVEGTKVLGSYM